MAKQYYGTKKISAEPMTRADYNKFRGWELPANENGADEGYLVEYLDGGKPNVEGYAGYVSWSPQEQFEKAYQPLDAMSFGHAILALLDGKRVCRSGWNGKGMFIALMPELKLPAFNSQEPGAKVNDRTAKFIGNDTPLDSRPYFAMKTATGQWQPGWLASQADMLSNDWMIYQESDEKTQEVRQAMQNVEVGPSVAANLLDIIFKAAGTVHKESGVPSDVTGAVVDAVEDAIKKLAPPVEEKAA